MLILNCVTNGWRATSGCYGTGQLTLQCGLDILEENKQDKFFPKGSEVKCYANGIIKIDNFPFHFSDAGFATIDELKTFLEECLGCSSGGSTSSTPMSVTVTERCTINQTFNDVTGETIFELTPPAGWSVDEECGIIDLEVNGSDNGITGTLAGTTVTTDQIQGEVDFPCTVEVTYVMKKEACLPVVAGECS